MPPWSLAPGGQADPRSGSPADQGPWCAAAPLHWFPGAGPPQPGPDPASALACEALPDLLDLSLGLRVACLALGLVHHAAALGAAGEAGDGVEQGSQWSCAFVGVGAPLPGHRWLTREARLRVLDRGDEEWSTTSRQTGWSATPTRCSRSRSAWAGGSKRPAATG